MQISKYSVHKCIINCFIIFLIQCLVFSIHSVNAQEKLILKNNWEIKSSKEVKENGEIISDRTYTPINWHQTTIPSTVLASLVKNNVYQDPYYGTNIELIPGHRVEGLRDKKTSEDSPFSVSWWYRTEFKLPVDYKNKNIWLHFHSINYKANVWLNGKIIADTTTVEGAYRLFGMNITDCALSRETNCLALEIFPPKSTDLSITWVDWNPSPPDKAMGIWYDAYITTSGPVIIRYPHIITDLNLPSLDKANLTITAELTNAGNKPVTGILKGEIEDISFSQEVKLAPEETKLATFSPKEFEQLEVKNPRLWWPNLVGPQNLYDLRLTFEIEKKVSDTQKVRFGIRKITSFINTFDDKRTRVFQINGKNIVVKGGGYVEDMLLRPSQKRDKAEILYAKHMNLNALRMEAFRGSDYLYDLCDELGIMVIAGWCCCSIWEMWDRWTEHSADVAEKSWKDQIIRLRNHPCVINWLYGSDKFPPANMEKRYIDIIQKYDGTRPYQSSATQAPSEIAGYTGLWMGPFPKVYSYAPPTYWYGKLEFNTEAGPSGEQISPIESMRKMMPEKDLWPISKSWEIRLHKRFYPDARKALFSRYGEPIGLEEYCKKSQVFQQEAVQAMFEAFAKNKYKSSGIIYWMYNSAWPTLYWQLYDYYLTPNGAFYGTKKASEPLHILYAYDDNSIYVVNEYYKDFKDMRAIAKVYNFDMKEKFSREIVISVLSDESKKAFKIELPEGMSNVYFIRLELRDKLNNLISSNFYWLSTKSDENADFNDLNKLLDVNLNVSHSPLKKEGNKYSLSVDFENLSSSLAFAINPKIKKSNSKDLVLPVFWEDNYFSLLPKEKKIVKVEFNAEDLDGESPILEIEGWNVKSLEMKIE